MKLKNYFFLVLFAMFTSVIMAQESYGPTASGTMNDPIYVPSIAEQIENGTFKAADNTPMLGHPKTKLGNNVIPGKGSTGNDPLADLQRNAEQRRNSAPILVWDADISQATPSDPTGAAGPNHYVTAWNSAFRIWDKDGNPLTPEASLGTIFPGNTLGDPIVFYDAAADRIVITEFDNSPNGFNVAVCQGSDPVNDGWHVYTTGFGTGSFPDYTKFAVFGDVYMVTANIGATNKVFAVERNEMLNGDPAQFVALPLPGIATSGFYSPHAFHTTDDDLAPAGTPVPIVYLQDDAWGGVTDDHLKVWSATIDWTNTSNSSISTAQQITTTDFISVFDGGNFANLGQPSGPDIDALQATMMNQVQYRRFPGYNSAVMTFVVDTDGSSAELAGIRWYELRQNADGDPWTIYQEGTYTSPDGKHAFSGSIGMNGNGDIAIAYSTVSNSDMLAINYTGRLDGDALNTMTIAEELIAQSSANSPTTRVADYTHLTVDPADDLTFWNISEYFNSNRRDVACHFALGAPEPDDIGITDITAPNSGPLGATESITVNIKNFGSNDVTNPEVQFILDGGAAEVENYSGTIAAGATESYTFTATGDFSVPGNHTIVAKTNLPGDTNTGNDEFTKIVNTGEVYCTPTATAGCNLDGIKKFVLNTIDADDGGAGCNTEPASSPQGYADRTNLSTDLSNLAGSNVYTLQAQQNWSPETDPPFNPGDEGFAVWIDFDDSGSFEPSELLIDSAFQLSGELEDFTLTIPEGAPLGAHRLRAKAIDITGSDVLTNPCDDFSYGEVQDYTVVIVGELGVEDPTISEAEFTIVTQPNNQFEITLTTDFDGIASIAVYNVLGQTLAFNNLQKQGDSYVYNLDMSYVDAGVYFVKMGDNSSKTYKTAKIIVK